MDNVTSFHNNLKKFIMAAKQYLYCHNESSFNTVLCSLQILGQPSNQFVFDSENILLEEFYINLYEVMNSTNDKSDIMWTAINVLYSNLKQGIFCSSKLNSYKFTSILIKLLKDHLSLDQKIKILRLLQELTYGNNLQWEESYLSELITLLVKWILNDNSDLISFSIGVLVNVCYKNKFGMFTLVKCAHTKSFMRTLLKLETDDIFLKVHVYKLLLILEKVCGQLPSIDIHKLIDLIFIILEEGLNQRHVFVLRHAVDFFIDISEHAYWKNSVLDYTDYKKNLNNLLNVMSNLKHIEKSHSNYRITLQSTDLVLKFIHHVIQLKNEDLLVLYPKIIMNFLHWTRSLLFQQKAIAILQTIIINLRIYNNFMDQILQSNIYEKFVEILNVLLIYLIESNVNFENTSNTCTWDIYASIFKLLQEVLKIQMLYEIIDEKLSFSSVQSMFHSLILIDIKDLNNLQNIAHVYIEALCLLSDLVVKNPMWMNLYSELLNEKHVYNVLAFVIYNEPKSLKQKVLYLITKFSQQSIIMLSESMEEMEQFSPKVKITNNKNVVENEIKPLFSFAGEKQLQMCIDQLENMLNSNEIHDIKTSNVIKLYQCKMNVFKQSEVWLKQSLHNASGEIAHLNYKVVSLNSESMQLNQMLLENQETIDALTMENNELKKELNDITEKYSAINNDFAKITLNYKLKCQIIQDHDSTIKNLEKQLEELQIINNNVKIDLLNQLQTVKTENKARVLKFEQQLIDKESIINEKTEEIKNTSSFIRNLENIISEKDKVIDELRKDLQEQRRVHEMISQMLAATSSKPKFSDN